MNLLRAVRRIDTISGTRQGGRKLSATIKSKYGVDEYGKSVFHKRVGALGGAASGTGGFFANRELAREAGRKGGLKSRKQPKDWAEFIRIFNESKSMSEAAEQLNMKPASVNSQAVKLRKEGYAIKYFRKQN